MILSIKNIRCDRTRSLSLNIKCDMILSSNFKCDIRLSLIKVSVIGNRYDSIFKHYLLKHIPI